MLAAVPARSVVHGRLYANPLGPQRKTQEFRINGWISFTDTMKKIFLTIKNI